MVLTSFFIFPWGYIIWNKFGSPIGIKILNEEEWEDLISRAKPLDSSRTSPSPKPKKTQDLSDSESEDVQPSTSKTKVVKYFR